MTRSAAPAHGGVTVEDIDRHEVERNVDLLARRYLRMSGEDFMQRKQRGELEGMGDSAGLHRVLSAATLLD